MSLFKRNQKTIVHDDWYANASLDERQEYDAFGPWTFEINSESEMPRRFRPWYPELASSTFLLKFPIHKERRLARPGEDLYRQVLAVDAQQLCLLSWTGQTVERKIVRLTDLQAARSHQVLLLGEVSFYLADGDCLRINYNAVSRPLLEKVLDFLRQGWQVASDKAQKISGIAKLPMDYYFANLVVEYQRRLPYAQLVYCEEPGARVQNEKGRRRRSLGILILETDRDWVFLTRGKAIRKAREAVHGSTCTFVPKTSIKQVKITDVDPELPLAGRELGLQVAGHILDFRIFGDGAALTRLIER